MLLRPLTALTAAALLLLAGCSKPTPEQLAEQERAQIREKKRQDAIKIYKQIEDDFPDSPRAKEAAAARGRLEAEAPPKK